MRYELLNNGQPTGEVILADEAFMAEQYLAGSYRVAAQQDAPTALTRHMTKLGFRNRFTPAEKIAIEIACLDDPSAPMPLRQQAAMLRASQADQRDATYIDLDRADTRNGVQALEAVGILAAGRALQILDAPVTEEDRFKG
jgi:hypothetical protein